MGSNSSNILETIAPAIPDEEVVTRVLRGETSLFELIIRRHNQRLYRATRAILRDESEAEDAIQEAYVRERAAYHSELQHAIEAAVDKLPPRYRSVFVLRDIEDMSGAEAAECLGINEVAVKTRLHRARRMLRGRLERTVSGAASLAFGFGDWRCDRMTRLVMARIDGYEPAGKRLAGKTAGATGA